MTELNEIPLQEDTIKPSLWEKYFTLDARDNISWAEFEHRLFNIKILPLIVLYILWMLTISSYSIFLILEIYPLIILIQKRMQAINKYRNIYFFLLLSDTWIKLNFTLLLWWNNIDDLWFWGSFFILLIFIITIIFTVIPSIIQWFHKSWDKNYEKEIDKKNLIKIWIIVIMFSFTFKVVNMIWEFIHKNL